MWGCEYCLDTTVVQRKGWTPPPPPGKQSDTEALCQPPPPPLPPPFKGPKCLSGVGVKDCTWAPPMPTPMP